GKLRWGFSNAATKKMVATIQKSRANHLPTSQMSRVDDDLYLGVAQALMVKKNPVNPQADVCSVVAVLAAVAEMISLLAVLHLALVALVIPLAHLAPVARLDVAP